MAWYRATPCSFMRQILVSRPSESIQSRGRAFSSLFPHKAQGEVPCRERPSVQEFNDIFYEPQMPVIITGAMADWGAMKWTPETLRQRFGSQFVPVELSRWHPQERRWGDYRDLYKEQSARVTGTRGMTDMEEYFVPRVPMLLGNFIDLFLDPPAGGKAPIRAHLAQHQILAENSAMGVDVIDPAYCSVGRGVYQRNIWCGSQHTATPLHRDPYHNLFAQVWGTKRILLFAPSQSSFLHPFETSLLLRNTSQVDVAAPDAAERWPGFSSASAVECCLRPGEILYIPLKWWHYVRAEETSLSFSFWWS